MDEYAIVVDIITEIVAEEPPLLFDLAALQREANRLLGLSAAETLRCAQSLYEAVLLTYPRTSSHYITPDMEPSVAALASGANNTAQSNTTVPSSVKSTTSGNAAPSKGTAVGNNASLSVESNASGNTAEISSNIKQLVKVEDGANSTTLKKAENGKPDLKAKDGSSTHSILPSEGNIGTYKALVKAGRRGDNITPHHMPSAEYMRRKGIAKNDGLCMNIEMPSPGNGGRHRLTTTYGRNMDDDQKKHYYSLEPRDALAHDLKDIRNIYKKQGLWPEIRPKIQEFIMESKERYPELFEKQRR